MTAWRQAIELAIGETDLAALGAIARLGILQRIPVKLTHSQHVESSCGILHEKVSE